jgi:hypothetical protein
VNKIKISKVLPDILNNKWIFFDVLFILVGALLDKDSKQNLKSIQSFSLTRSSLSFLQFSIKDGENTDVNKLYKLIKNEFFNKINLLNEQFHI